MQQKVLSKNLQPFFLSMQKYSHQQPFSLGNQPLSLGERFRASKNDGDPEKFRREVSSHAMLWYRMYLTSFYLFSVKASHLCDMIFVIYEWCFGYN